MNYADLKEQVWQANMDLAKSGLVVLTWGNASGVDRQSGVMAIKPSGVPYEMLKPNNIVIVSLEDGCVVDGKSSPSSDTPTHLHLYRTFDAVGGVVHTHSLYATSFCQAGRELPCLGTTHSDNFHGSVPLTRQLTSAEIADAYELNTGKVITEYFQLRHIRPLEMPAVLIAGHAPFTWGTTPEKALENAIVLEFAAQMAINTWQLNPDAVSVSQNLLDKHFFRKHGDKAYYGQPV